MNWLPDRKILAGGIAGVLTWLVVTAFNHFGIQVPMDIQSGITTAVTLAVAYLVPPAERDIVKRINDDLVKMAAADPSNPTTAVVPPKT